MASWRAGRPRPSQTPAHPPTADTPASPVAPGPLSTSVGPAGRGRGRPDPDPGGAPSRVPAALLWPRARDRLGLLSSAPPARAALRPRLRRLPSLPPVGRRWSQLRTLRSANGAVPVPVRGQRRRGPCRAPRPPGGRLAPCRFQGRWPRWVPSPRAGGRGARPGEALSSLSPHTQAGAPCVIYSRCPSHPGPAPQAA